MAVAGQRALLSAILQMNKVEMEMNEGLLRTTSAFAIAAAAGVFATSAMAADLGGSCCADLEERVAELEATTARKGNRRVRLTVSGHVNETLLFWDDGEESNAYVVTNENSRTRFRFSGDAKINPEWSAGFLIEVGVRAANSAGVNQFVDDDTSSTASLDLRHSAWWIESSRLGRVWVGFTDTATDGITGINLSNASLIATNAINDWNGGFLLRRDLNAVSALSALRWQDISSQANANVGSGDQRNEIRYVSPTLHGFTFSAAWGEDDFADAALRYAAEFRGVRVAAGIGYQQYTDANAFRGGGIPTGSQGDRGCADLDFTTPPLLGPKNDSDADCSAVGLSGSVMHVATGLYIHGAYGKLEDENRETLFARQPVEIFGIDPDGSGPLLAPQLTSGPIAQAEDEDQHWYVQGGIERNFFGIGKSAFYGELFHGDTGAGLATGNVRTVAFNDPINPLGAGAFIGSSEVDVWGVGLVQSIDAAAMDLYLGFRNYSGEVELVSSRLVTVTDTNNNAVTRRVTVSKDVDVEDFQIVMAGGIIRF
jgi:predicted porin